MEDSVQSTSKRLQPRTSLQRRPEGAEAILETSELEDSIRSVSKLMPSQTTSYVAGHMTLLPL